MSSGDISRERAFELFEIYGMKPTEVGRLLDQIEKLMYITAGTVTVVIARVSIDTQKEIITSMIEQFERHGVAIVVVPTESKFEVDGTATAKSWSRRLYAGILDSVRRVRSEVFRNTKLY